ALIDPAAQQSDLFGRELVSLGRHDDVGVEPGDILDQEALCALADFEGGPRIAAANRIALTIEPKTGQLLLFAVALQAVGLEDRSDVAIEIDRLRGGRRQPLGALVVAGQKRSDATRDREQRSDNYRNPPGQPIDAGH